MYVPQQSFSFQRPGLILPLSFPIQASSRDSRHPVPLETGHTHTSFERIDFFLTGITQASQAPYKATRFVKQSEIHHKICAILLC